MIIISTILDWLKTAVLQNQTGLIESQLVMHLQCETEKKKCF